MYEVKAYRAAEGVVWLSLDGVDAAEIEEILTAHRVMRKLIERDAMMNGCGVGQPRVTVSPPVLT